ncbi:hypothetical protein Tco_0818101 [Tanacetum coccineum]
MSTPKFAETHNLVAFLEKPEESNGFEEIINFLNASSVQYALMINPTIYTTCIEQFWTSAKVKTINGERQIQALVDKKKVIISETSIRSDLKLDDAKGTDCLPTAIIFCRIRKNGGRKIEDLDVDVEVTLVDETQEMNDDNLMFDTGVLEEQGIEFEKVVEEPVVSVATTTRSILIKTAKPKPVITAATTVTSVRPKAKGIIFYDQEEQVPAPIKIFSFSQSQLPQVKEKGKGKMVEPEVPLKKKDQVDLDVEMVRNLEAQLQAELIEEERLTRQKEEEANIALIES